MNLSFETVKSHIHPIRHRHKTRGVQEKGRNDLFKFCLNKHHSMMNCFMKR